MLRTKTWWFDDYETRNLFLAGGASSQRGLRANFLAPKTFIGSQALKVFLEEVADGLLQKRALFITDEVMAPAAREVAERFSRFNFEVEVWDGVQNEAPLSNIKEGARMAREYQPFLLVAFGGGSVIDAAKAIFILYEKDMDIRRVHPLEALGLRRKGLLMAIPTTSGTGSESTLAAVITDDEEEIPVKAPVMHGEIVPDFAIVDSRYVMGMPVGLTMGSGLDVLTHAVEAYISSWSIDYTDPLALQAVRLVLEYLPRSVQNGKDREARYKMHVASNLAGLSFANANVGLAHSAGHAFGKVFNVHHGIAVGLFLPYVLQHSSRITSKGDALARELGLLPREEDREGKGTSVLVERFRELYRLVGGPMAGKDLLAEKDFRENLELLCQAANEDVVSLVAVRPINLEGYRTFMEYVFYGRDIDF